MSNKGEDRQLRRRQTFVGDVVHHMYTRGCHTTIHAVMEFDETVSLQALQTLCRDELLQYPRFACRVSEDGHWWEPVTVDIDHHVTEAELVGDDAQAAIEAKVSEVLLREFDPTRPMWSASILNHAPSGTCYILWRISHSIGDGITLASLLMSLGKPIEDQGVAVKPAAITAGTGSGKPAGSSTVVQVIVAIVFAVVPSVLLALYAETIVGWAKAITIVLWSLAIFLIFEPTRMFLVALGKINFAIAGWSDPHTPIKSRRSQLGDKKLFAKGEALSVSEIKKVAKALGAPGKATVNDVMMSCVAGGVNRYCKKKGHAAGNKEHVAVRFLTIVNTRAAKGLRDPAKMLSDYKSARWGNDFSYYIIPLDVGDQPVVHRLRNAQRQLAYLKRSPEGFLINFLNTQIWKAFCCVGAHVVKFLTLHTFSHFQTFVSNLAAPQLPLRFAGSPLRSVYNCTAPIEFGMTFNMLSYNGQLVTCTACDPQVVPKPHEVLSCINEEFAALQKAASEENTVMPMGDAEVALDNVPNAKGDA